MRGGSGVMATPPNRWGSPEMLKQRVITAVLALIVLLAVLFLLPGVVAQLVIAALMTVAAWEWSGFVTPGENTLRVTYAASLALMGAALLWYLPDRRSLYWVEGIAVAWWLAAFLWLFFYPTGIPKALALLAGALVIVPSWLALDFLYGQHALVLLAMLAIVWAADIGAYFAGKFFGRVKLAPAVSPGKTWEGAIGGMFAVLALALAYSTTLDLEALAVVPLCLAIAVVSIVGDLTVSMFKRSAGVKDSGHFFPGHGGVLDRIDSVTAAAPLFVLGAGWIGVEL